MSWSAPGARDERSGALPHEFTVARSPWGPDDEIGSLNHITPESRSSVMSRVDGSRVFDLSCDYFVGMPTWSALGDPPYQIYKTHDPAGDVVSNPIGLDDEANQLTSYTGDAIAMYTHSGTHIDALNHFGCHGEIFNGFRAHEHFKISPRHPKWFRASMWVPLCVYIAIASPV